MTPPIGPCPLQTCSRNSPTFAADHLAYSGYCARARFAARRRHRCGRQRLNIRSVQPILAVSSLAAASKRTLPTIVAGSTTGRPKALRKLRREQLCVNFSSTRPSIIRFGCSCVLARAAAYHSCGGPLPSTICPALTPSATTTALYAVSPVDSFRRFRASLAPSPGHCLVSLRDQTPATAMLKTVFATPTLCHVSLKNWRLNQTSNQLITDALALASRTWQARQYHGAGLMFPQHVKPS